MPEIIKRKILKLLKHANYVPQRPAQLAKALGISQQDYPQFKTAVEELCQEGHLTVGGKESVQLAPLPGKITGTFRLNQKGFGFVKPLESNLHSDLFIPPDAAAGALTGDIVLARITKQSQRDSQIRYSGIVVEIIQRGENKLVGTLSRKNNLWVVLPDGKAFTEPIIVDDVSAKDAKVKDKVVVEIISYPDKEGPARGVITKVLGRAGQYESEISSIIHQYHLPGEFSGDCLDQARQASAAFAAGRTAGREDLTGKTIVTIDPPDAKDFDDAISLERDAKGNWLLGVHIADVANFIPAGSPLDAEAVLRGNSIYLPGRTIPMLPEILSNGICSLQPQQRRFTKSVFITYDSNGKVIGTRFTNSIICSVQRLTYLQTDNALKGHTKGIELPVMSLLRDMEKLARIIEQRRSEAGSIHLDLTETELIFDKAGRVIDAKPADNSYPHTIIEMFMVAANEAVASLLDRLNVPFIRRIHPEPDSLTMKNLVQYVRALGFNMSKTADRFAVQDLIAAARDNDCALGVNMLVLRSFERAVYSPLRIGHYALASSNYCHFTSPIRRYADLLVHRLLEQYLQTGSVNDPESEDRLSEAGKHITLTEELAADAEEELKAVLILQMLSSHIGDELDGVVTGLVNPGIFVRSTKFGIEGFVPTAELGADTWRFNPRTQCMVGQRCGHVIHIGQAMKVRIVSVNVAGRRMELTPSEPLVRQTDRPTGSRKDRTKKQKFRRRRR